MTTINNPLVVSSVQVPVLPPPSYYYYYYNNQQQQQQQQQLIVDRPTNILSYSYQWKQHQQQQQLKQKQSNYNDTVFGLSFLNNTSSSNSNSNNNNNSSSWLAGCTKSGYLCIWLIENNNDDNDIDDDNDNHSSNNDNNININNNNSYKKKTLVWSQQVISNGGTTRTGTCSNVVVLYECKFIPSCMKDNNNTNNNTNTNNWLSVSGDGGIYLYDFNQQIVPQIEQNLLYKEQNNSINTRTTKNNDNIRIIQPLHVFSTYPSPYGRQSIEINNFIVKDNNIYGAAGDSFCYKWNIHTQQCVQTYHNNNTTNNTTSNKNNSNSFSSTMTTNNDYLQTIESIPNTNLILTGSDCGIVTIWDTNHDSIVDQYNMNYILTNFSNTESNNDTANNNNNSINDSVSILPAIKDTKRVSSSSSLLSTKTSMLDSSSNNNSNSTSTCSISSCIVKDENFWIVAGGTSTTGSTINSSIDTSSNKRPRNTIFGTSTSTSATNSATGSSSISSVSGGYIATIHGPTRTWISVVNTIETPNQLAMIDTTNNMYTNNNNNNNNNTYSNTNVNNNTIVTVSNDNYIRFWDTKVLLNQQQTVVQQQQSQSQLQQQPYQKIYCNTPCGYSISINPISSQLAVGGVGTIINLYDNYNQPSSIPINIHKY